MPHSFGEVIGNWEMVRGLRKIQRIRSQLLSGKWELLYSKPPYSSHVAVVRDAKTKELFALEFDSLYQVRLRQLTVPQLKNLVEDGRPNRENFVMRKDNIVYQLPRSGGEYAYILDPLVSGNIQRFVLAGSVLVFQTTDNEIFASKILVI